MAEVVEIITLVFKALGQVPLAIWTGIGGASIPLITLILTNRQKNKEQTRQHEHDATEKLKQRLADLRRSVYLNGAEEIVKANAAIGAMITTDLTKVSGGADLQGLFASLMKLQMVGSPKTAQLANDLASSYGEVLGRTMVQAMPLKLAVGELSVQDGLRETHSTEVQRLLAAMKAINESGVADPVKFAALNASMDFCRKQMAEIDDLRGALHEKITKFQLDFMHAIPDTMSSLTEQHTPLLVEIRRELDVGGDIESFKAMMTKQAQRMKGMTDRMGAELQPKTSSFART